MPHRSAVLLLITCSVLWSLGGVLVKSVDWPSLAKVGARSGLAAVVLWAWLKRPIFTWSRRQLGIAAAYAATVTLFIVANDRTTAANAIFLQYTAPIYVALGGPRLRGARPPRRGIAWLCIAVALGGIALFFRDALGVTGLLGNLAGLGSGLSFATMVLLLRLHKASCPPP